MAEQPVKALAVSEDGDFLCFAQGPAKESLTGGPYEVCLYELATAKRIGVFPTEFFPHATGLSLNGEIVAASARDGRLMVWNIDSQTPRHEWTLPFACRPVFLPDGRHLVTINNNGTAYVFRLSHVSSQ